MANLCLQSASQPEISVKPGAIQAEAVLSQLCPGMVYFVYPALMDASMLEKISNILLSFASAVVE